MNGTEQAHTVVQPGPSPHPAPYPAVAVAGRRDPREKSVPLACVLSVMPGLGQVYVGYYQRGFVHAIVVATLITILSHDIEAIAPLFGLFLGFFWLYNIIDAGRRASLYNQALIGTESIELPQDFKFSGTRGSIGGGLLLIAFGAILLSKTRFGYSLEWIEEWWPVAPILLGVYLLFRAIEDRIKPRG
jgi:hypothetical protein